MTSAASRAEWRQTALLALVVSDASRRERRLAEMLVAASDALDEAEARNQWLGDAS